MKTYLITGAGGMIGGLLMDYITKTEDYNRNAATIIAAVRDKEKFQLKLAGYDLSRITVVEADVRDGISIEKQITATGNQVDYLLHCAAPTASHYMTYSPVETADAIVLGTRSMLELARRLKIRSMVYLSSMEVYGKVDDIGRTRSEEELGSMDLCAARSSYPMAKRMAEHYCHIYHKQHDVPVKIARLAQVFGKGVRKDDRRVYMQMACAALKGEDIRLHTGGMSVGNYCASDDAVTAIITILDKGSDGEVYNVVNETNTIRIRDMAYLVKDRIADGKIDVIIDSDEKLQSIYAPDTELRLSADKLRKLGWQPRKNLLDMYGDLISELAGKEKTIGCE